MIPQFIDSYLDLLAEQAEAEKLFNSAEIDTSKIKLGNAEKPKITVSVKMHPMGGYRVTAEVDGFGEIKFASYTYDLSSKNLREVESGYRRVKEAIEQSKYQLEISPEASLRLRILE